MKNDQKDEEGNRIRFDQLTRRWHVWRPDEWKWELMAEQLAPPDIDESLRIADAESAREEAEAIHAERYPPPNPEVIMPVMPPYVPANRRDEGEAADREAARIDDEKWRYS